MCLVVIDGNWLMDMLNGVMLILGIKRMLITVILEEHLIFGIENVTHTIWYCMQSNTDYNWNLGEQSYKVYYRPEYGKVGYNHYLQYNNDNTTQNSTLGNMNLYKTDLGYGTSTHLYEYRKCTIWYCIQYFNNSVPQRNPSKGWRGEVYGKTTFNSRLNSSSYPGKNSSDYHTVNGEPFYLDGGQYDHWQQDQTTSSEGTVNVYYRNFYL